MAQNVLVFPCGTEIALEIHRSLSFSRHFTLFGASSVADHGAFVYENYIQDIPFIDAPDFIEKLNLCIDEYEIDYIIPAHDSVVLLLAQAKEAGNLHCELITSPLETCEITRSKEKTYEVFKDSPVHTPIVYSAEATLSPEDFPLFLKPAVGQGSKGTHIVHTTSEITDYLAQDPTLLILEYLPGEEYTVDCFTSKDGTLLHCMGRGRQRISNGISVRSAVVHDDRFRELATAISTRLAFRGVWFFQVKKNTSGDLVLMEIAPRVAGTMGLSRARGANLVLLSLFDAHGYDVSVVQNDEPMVVDRALESSYNYPMKYQHVYMDFDDLVIYKGKVNPSVMAFVFQCHNYAIKVHLITRHKEDLNTSLEHYRLSGIFDELIQIEEGDRKYLHIQETNAIFIDDSYAERQEVHQHLGIPVFDAHMLEVLREYA